MKILKQNKKEDGQSLVEFALILPILLLLVVGIIDFGWLFMAEITTNNAAREAARRYVVISNKSAAETAGRNAALSVLSFMNMEVGPNVTFDSTTNPVEVKVMVSGEVKPLVGLFITENIDVSSTSYMKLEN